MGVVHEDEQEDEGEAAEGIIDMIEFNEYFT